jgi:hypothetical protein
MLIYQLFHTCRRQLATNFKSIKFTGARRPVYLDGLYVGAFRSTTQGSEKLLKRLTRTLADDLDGAIRQIPHIAGNPKRTSASLRPHAKADALDLSVNDGAQLDT